MSKVVYNIVMTFLNRFSAFLLPLLFFIIGLLTLYDYGINWDSPVHFARGQAYLRYILTGKTNYDGLLSYCMNDENLISRVDVKSGEICDRHRKIRVSEYESPLLDFNSWVAKSNYGHPAFSDIMLAGSNNIFFKTLGWVEDIDAYHLYSLFTTFLLALTVSIWIKQTFGTFSAIIAVLVIYTFPLLSGEQHFNVKDPPMAAFFTISLYLFWASIVKKKPLYMILSALSGGASFGTKLNFVFAPFILLPWIIVYGKMLLDSKMVKTLLSKKMLISFGLYPIIVFLVFFLSWPALWSDPVKNISEVIRFYRDIGGSTCSYQYLTFLWFTKCSQLTTIQYLLHTTPPFTILLFAVGFIASLFQFRKFQFVTVLWLSFFFVTIARVTFSISSIYGGSRQIIEFITPLAMISGVGALFLREKLTKILSKIFVTQKFNIKVLTAVASLIIISGFVPIFVTLLKLHPNENIYFNSFIGGLKGAAQKDFPGYGNTYGNASLQGVKWLNRYGVPNSKLALISGNAQEISRGILREDISLANGYRSGYNQTGEYQMLLTTGQVESSELFRYMYLSYLNPVYDLKVDGVSILKIWKNDKNYLKNGINLNETKEQIEVKGNEKEIVIKLDEKKNLKSLGFTFPNTECKKGIIGVKIYVSIDGKEFVQKADEINGFADEEIKDSKADFIYFFPGDEAQFIKITPPARYPCNLEDINFSLFTFKADSR